MEDVTDDVFADLVGGLKQIDAHVRGEETTIRFRVPEELNVAAIRQRSGTSQPAFAKSIGINVATLKQWEQGRRKPQGPARVLLAMIEREPGVVARVLGKSGSIDEASSPKSGEVLLAKPKRRPSRAA